MERPDTLLIDVSSHVGKNPHAWNSFMEKMNKALQGRYKAQRWLLSLVEKYLLYDPRLGLDIPVDEKIKRIDYDEALLLFHEDGGFALDLLNAEISKMDTRILKKNDYQTVVVFSKENISPIKKQYGIWASMLQIEKQDVDTDHLFSAFCSLPILIDNLIYYIVEKKDCRAILLFHFLFKGGFRKLLDCIMYNENYSFFRKFIVGCMAEMTQPTRVLDSGKNKPMYENLREKWSGLNWKNEAYIHFLYGLRRFVYDRFTEYEIWHKNILEDRNELYKMLGLNMSNPPKVCLLIFGDV